MSGTPVSRANLLPRAPMQPPSRRHAPRTTGSLMHGVVREDPECGELPDEWGHGVQPQQHLDAPQVRLMTHMNAVHASVLQCHTCLQ